jgi:hypothetical protein
MAKKDVSEQPCAGCPWLSQNQTPAAVEASPIGGDGAHWFDPRNLLKHWRAVQQRGVMLPCHETDPNAPFYGGRPAKGHKARICIGLTILARREVQTFMEAGQEMRYYRQRPGKRLTAAGLAGWASRLYFGGAIFNLGARSFRMPEHVEDDPRVTVPWADSVHRKEQ